MATVKCIYGAPCSGKSTFVEQNYKEGDIVWDYDNIKQACLLTDKHEQGTYAQNSMILEMRYTFAKNAPTSECDTVWFICTQPTDTIRDLLGEGAEYIEMKATEQECYDRLEADDTRQDKEYMRELIYKYFHPEEVRTMVKVNEREYRNFTLAVVELENNEAEQAEERMLVSGYASVFNHPYTLYEDDEIVIQEQVDSKAFEGADMSDVIFQYNHEGRVFARVSNDTLKVGVDERGLKIEADLGGTDIGQQLYQEIKGGYTTQMSYGYTVKDAPRKDSKLEDGRTLFLRTVTAIGKVYDVSAVSIPANDATSISVRNLSDGVIEQIKAERLEALELEKRKLQLKLKMGGF